MNIANILLVSIDLPQLSSQLEEHGYNPLVVADIPSIIDIDVPFAVVLIHQNAIGEALAEDMERLYFVSKGAPIGVLISDHTHLSDGLTRALDQGTLERVYLHEVESGLATSRIDRMYLGAGLDTIARAYQQAEDDKELLSKEISLRNRLHEHERELNIMGSITSGLVVVDMTDKIFLMNEYARRLLRIAKNDVVGLAFREVLPDKVSRLAENALKRISGEWKHHEIKKITFDETVLEIAAYRMNDYEHRPVGLLMLINDITEQENTTVQLYRSEKLATLGTMLSGMAHELRNPLSIISARSQMALRKADWDKAWAAKTFESIDGQVNRCAGILNSLLEYTRYKATQQALHKLGDILDETLTHVEYQSIFDAITVEKDYQNGLVVFGDRSRFVQIFLNIILNAADAMAGKGVLKISARADKDSKVLVEIHDTGSGVDAAAKDRIFDPFFTTKDPGKGTGLGLAVAYKIIQDSGGEIWFTSEPGSTSFFVRLPSGKRKVYEGKTASG
ncbi:MAG TPA: ATP-binding protein [Chitinivibrionales bacterium]|nr:ATP-binding protein [Chitinivibrionales bacterium]